MTLVMQLLGIPFRFVPALSSAGAVGGATASGAEVAGSIGGLVGAAVAVGALFVTISANNRARRHEYEQEIAEAERRGEDRYRADMEFWREKAVGRLIDQGQPIPTPPSQQPHPRPGGST